MTKALFCFGYSISLKRTNKTRKLVVVKVRVGKKKEFRYISYILPQMHTSEQKTSTLKSSINESEEGWMRIHININILIW